MGIKVLSKDDFPSDKIQSQPGKIGWSIAGLELWVDSQKPNLLLSLPACYKNFLLPGSVPQAFFHVKEDNEARLKANSLILTIYHQEVLRPGAEAKSLFISESWEFWQTHAGHFVFFLDQSDETSTVMVDQDFKTGEIHTQTPINQENFFPIKHLEIRLFSAWLASLGDIILHASGIMLDKRGYAFLGDSGAGKSTLAAALSPHPGVTVLGEDQVVLRYLDGRFWMFGTPWHTNPALCSPAGTPVEKIFFLDRSLKPGAAQIKPVDGVSRILQTAVVPYYWSEKMPLILDRLALLADQIPFYTLSYTPCADILQLITQA